MMKSRMVTAHLEYVALYNLVLVVNAAILADCFRRQKFSTSNSAPQVLWLN